MSLDAAAGRILSRRARRGSRRGATYILVLGVTLIVATLSLAAIQLTRSSARVAAELSDAAEARQCAESGAELARLWIRQDPNWRTNRTAGVWSSNAPIGSGTFTVEASDPVDGNLANWPHDPLVLKVTGRRGSARHIVQFTLAARPTPLPALAYVAHAEGQVHIRAGKTFTATGAAVSSNGELQNDGTINGSISVATVDPLGTVTGTQTVGASAKALPLASIAETYAARGTQISAPNSIDKAVLAPGKNPYGALDSNGLYVIRTSNDLTIKNSRIYGTLVVITNNKKVVFDNTVLVHPYRSDFPSLIIVGNAEFIYSSGGLNTLSETLLLTNFNPPGAPYNGQTDGLVLNTYPSEIQGLVHVTGKATFKQTATIRGVLLAGGTGNDVIDVNDSPSVIYTPSLFANPPQWYTSEVLMPLQAGSYLELLN